MDISAARSLADESIPGLGQASVHANNEKDSHLQHALPPKPVLADSNTGVPIPEANSTGDHLQEAPGATGPGQTAMATSLPPEILQHIFSFVDPHSLGRLLPVSRLFNALLDPTKSLPSHAVTIGILRLKPQNDLWAVSRRTFRTGHPRPMEYMTELEMWRLIHGTKCQFCNKVPKTKFQLLASSPWNAGPGPEGVRAIWPFRCRSCGPCLEGKLVKEIDLMLSTKSVLQPGLPFAMFTPSLNYVTSVTLRQTPPPAGLQMTKYFFQPQVDDLDCKQTEVRAFGQAAHAEWYKGLESVGQSHMKDVARFEQWQVPSTSPIRPDAGNAGAFGGATSPAHTLPSNATHGHQFSLQSPHRPFSLQSTPLHPGTSSTGPQSLLAGALPSMPLRTFDLAPGQASTITSPFSPQHVGSGPAAFQPPLRPRQERNFQEVDRLKADRRAEIRRRCLQLDPPIQPSTLDFMDAFNAAVQIARPLNDADWDVLKDRLLAQRPEAERKEGERRTVVNIAQVQIQNRDNVETERRQTQASVDRMWEEIQKPSRDKSREFAEDFIKTHWADGKAINKTSSGRFAADVLLHVQRRHFDTIGQEDALLASQRIVLPQDSPIHETRRLKLEDMKYIFEETIRPRIDRFGREVFLCNTCETNAKRFTFDAVIQHYAAKHTSALSQGNAVVYWKADWPTEPPFHSTPETIWNRPPEARSGFLPFGATSPAYTPAYTPYIGASWMSPLAQAPGQPNGIYHVQSEELVASAKRIWDATDGIRFFPNTLRLYVIVHQVARSFSRRFTNEPTLSMFSDCVDHKPLLKPLKDLEGLSCKACHMYGETSDNADIQYVLTDLLSHFQSSHVESDARSPNLVRPQSMSRMSTPRMDWKFDMLELPPEPKIRAIVQLPGMNQQKLETIAEVLPVYFPTPLPLVESIPLETQDHDFHRPPFAPGRQALPTDPRAAFKRPLDEDQFSYPPPIRRVVEYDPYRYETSSLPQYPEAPPQRYPSYIDNGSRGQVVYVERSYVPPPSYGLRPFPPRPGDHHSNNGKYGPPQHVIYEVEDHSANSHNQQQRMGQPISPQQHDLRLTSPAPDTERPFHRREASPTAAENFLSNFDEIVMRPYEPDKPPGSVRSETRARLVEDSRRSQGSTPSRSRHNLDVGIDREPGSNRHSPHVSLAERHRSRNDSPIPPLDEHISTPQRIAYTEITRARNTVPLSPPPIPLRQPDSPPIDARHRESSSPRGEGAVPYEYDNYADLPRKPAYSAEPPSPEVQYRRYQETRPTRYIEVLPNGQRRVVEELPPSPTFERLEYASGSQRAPAYVNQEGYYVEQSIPYQAISYEDQQSGQQYQQYQYEPRTFAQYLPPQQPYDRHGPSEGQR